MDLINVDKMAESFTTVDELKSYSNAQYKTIVDLNKKLKRAEAELDILREKLETISVQQNNDSALKKEDGIFDITDEETVCLTQLALLRNLSLQRELTTEEAKKFEIFHKVINTIRNRKPDNKTSLSELSTDELVKLIDKTMEL
jgi:hypothetical protein